MIKLNKRIIEECARQMQKYYNDLRDTDYTWKCTECSDNEAKMVWSYCDVEMHIITGEAEGDDYIKSVDVNSGKTLRYYLIGNEFYHDYKNPALGIERLVKNSIQVMNSIY